MNLPEECLNEGLSYLIIIMALLQPGGPEEVTEHLDYLMIIVASQTCQCNIGKIRINIRLQYA